MSDEIKRLMDSPNVEDRKRAVRKLAETHDESALTFLGIIYKTDTSPEVRELASKAGRYLKQHAGKQAPPSVRQTYAAPVNAYQDDLIDDEEPVSTNAEAQAHDLMRRAKEQFDDANEEEARKLAARAFVGYRELKNDVYYVGLLGQIFEVDKDDAILALVDYIKGTKSTKKKIKHLDDTTFSDLILYYVVIALTILGGTVLLNVGLSLALRPQVEQLAQVLGEDPMTTTAVKNSMMQLQQVLAVSPDNLGTSVGEGLQMGISTLISLTISYFFINTVANGMAGGDGTFNGLVRATMFVNVGGNIISYVLMGVFVFTYLSTIFQGIYVSQIRDQVEPYQEAIKNATSMAGVFITILIILWLVLGAMFVRAIARNYKLGFLEGCGTVLVAIMVAGCSWCGIGFGTSALSLGFFMAGAQ